MALTATVQTAEGVDGANVYDPQAAFVEYLTDYGYSAFIAKDSGVQVRLMIQATRLAEQQAEPRVTGTPYEEDQDLLFPRHGALDSRERLIEGLPPLAYRQEGIMVLADHMASQPSERLSLARPRGHLKEERRGRFWQVHRDKDQTFSEKFPGVWSGLRSAWPRGPARQRRA